MAQRGSTRLSKAMISNVVVLIASIALLVGVKLSDEIKRHLNTVQSDAVKDNAVVGWYAQPEFI